MTAEHRRRAAQPAMRQHDAGCLLPGAFPGARGYLDSATLGLPAPATRDALTRAIDEWAAGRTNAKEFDDELRRSREAFARLGVPAGRVAAAGQVSSFVANIAASLPAGARVVAPEGEFTSVLFPVLAAVTSMCGSPRWHGSPTSWTPGPRWSPSAGCAVG